MNWFRRLFRPNPPPPADTTPPSDVVQPSGIRTASNITWTWTPATDNVAVAGYRVRLNGVAQSDVATPVFTALGLAAGNYHIDVKAFDPSNNVSVNWSPQSADITVPGAQPGPDVTAPPVPAQPTLVSGGGTTLAYRITWPLVTDTDPGDGSTISGTKDYLVYAGATQIATVSQPGAIGAEATYQIGGSTPTGSDDGATIVGGSGDHYGSADIFFFKAAPVLGDCTVFMDLNSVVSSAGNAYAKVGLELRGSIDPASTYFHILHFPSAGANILIVEWRDTAGASAQQIVGIAQGLPVRIRLTRSATTVTADYSTNGGASWTVAKTLVMSNLPTQILVGRTACANGSGTVSGGYTNYTLAGTSPVVYDGVGTAGTTVNITVKSRDNAGNVSAASTARSITFTSASKSIPSLALYLIGGNAYRYDTTAFQNYAKQMRSVIMGWNPGWDGGAAMNMHQIMTNIKAALGTKCFLYHDPTQVYPGTYTSYTSPMTSYNWQLRSSYPSGSLVTNGGQRIGNVVSGGPTDPNGRTYNQFLVDWCLDYMMNGGAAGLAGGTNVTNNLVDGLYLDDMQPGAVLAAGDWLRNGSSQSYGGAADSAIRNGYLDIMSKSQAAKPALLRGGNLSGACSNGGSPPISITEYVGQFDFGIVENVLGATYSWDINETVAQMITHTQLAATTLRAGHYACIGHNNLRSDGSDALTQSGGTITSYSPAWQGARHGFAYVYVMSDCDYAPAASDAYDAAVVIWMDFWKVNPTTHQAYTYAQRVADPTLGENWMGAAVGAAQTAPWSQGVYRREYTNGWMYWNPRGNGSKTVSLGGTFYLINSAQDSSYNGAAVTSLTLADRDGRWVFKT